MQTALINLEVAFRRLESQVPPPRLANVPSGLALRYVEHSIEQAIIQKAARQVSGLHAVKVLMSAGLYQEQGVIQRTLDEIGEDMMFLALALSSSGVTELHERFLAAFWMEEFDKPTALASTQKRGMVKRRNIRAFIARNSGLPDPAWQDTIGETVHKSYSGFVHGASPHIMDMCGGNPPIFHVAGLSGTPRTSSYLWDVLTYFYRAHLNLAATAAGFKDRVLFQGLKRAADQFEGAIGPNAFLPTLEEYKSVRQTRGS